MKSILELKQRPDDWLGTMFMDLQNFTLSTRPCDSSGTLTVHTQDGVIREPNPLDFWAQPGTGSTDSGVARWA